jgi:FkbM family methyltransferase
VEVQVITFSGRPILEWRCPVELSTIVRAQSIAAVVALLVFGSACGAGPEEQPTESSFEPGSGAPGRGKIDTAIAKINEELRNVEGREGILAEKRLYSTFDEELIIRDFFQDRRGGFFLDVGCARPVRGSNTYYLEKHLGWRGIGVDALEEYGPGWKKMRPNSRFLRYLVTDHSGVTETFFKSLGLGTSSTDREWASGKVFGVDLPTEEVQTDTITLDDLLDREGVTKIDLLSMDIEGHEPKALAGFDIERFQPELVVIEGQVETQKKREVSSYFERRGYELIEKYRPFDRVNDYFKRKGP